MTTVWAVENTDYESSETVAVFTSKRLAEQHASDRGSWFQAVPHRILSHRPDKLCLEYRSAHVFSDGRVERHYTQGGPVQEYWDYEAPNRVTLKRGDHSTSIGVHAEPGTAKEELLRHVDTVLGWYGAAAGWDPEQLAQAKDNARWEGHPPVPVSRCYRTASGLPVHVRSGCRCPG